MLVQRSQPARRDLISTARNLVRKEVEQFHTGTFHSLLHTTASRAIPIIRIYMNRRRNLRVFFSIKHVFDPKAY